MVAKGIEKHIYSYGCQCWISLRDSEESDWYRYLVS